VLHAKNSDPIFSPFLATRLTSFAEHLGQSPNSRVGLDSSVFSGGRVDVATVCSSGKMTDAISLVLYDLFAGKWWSVKLADAHAASKNLSRAILFFELCDESSNSTAHTIERSSGLQSTKSKCFLSILLWAVWRTLLL